MAYSPRGEETVRVAEVLEGDFASPTEAATAALEMAWGLILMRNLAMARTGLRQWHGPYASLKDAEKCPGADAWTMLFGPGRPAQNRRGGPWVDWCRCGHRHNDHATQGAGKGHCQWSECSCMRSARVTAKTTGAGWKPAYTWTPRPGEVEVVQSILNGDYETPGEMAKAVLKQAFLAMQQREAKVFVFGAMVAWGPYDDLDRAQDLAPPLSTGLTMLQPPLAKKGGKK